MTRLVVLVAVVLVILGMRCSGTPPTSGGAGGETTNGIYARVVYPEGTPAAHAVIRVRAAEFLSDTLVGIGKRAVTTHNLLTDGSGRFFADSLDSGEYAIEATDANGNAVLSFCIPDSATDLGTLILRSPGEIQGRVLGAGKAIIRIHGLERCVRTDADGAFAVAVPTGHRLTVNVTAAQTVTDTLLPAPVLASQPSVLIMNVGTYRGDSLAVRAFLDSMGFSGVSVASVTGLAPDGRISQLNLANRGIVSLHPLVGSLHFLYEINLNDNTLTDLPKTLATMPMLWHLLLRNNPLDSLPPVVPEIPALKLLEISGTRITLLPPSLSRCRGLEVLAIENTGMTQFPTVVMTLPNLYGLSLAGNLLRTIPPEIAQCPSLAEFDISGNQLDSLPQAFGSLPKLRILYAYSNNLKRLPVSMGALAALEILHLEANQLDSLPSGIGALNRIRTLELSFNNLTAIPELFTNLTPSRSLKVLGNQLCSPSQSIADWIDRYSAPGWRTSQRGCP